MTTPIDEALVSADHFPFMKLPLELRHRVYKHYIANLFDNGEAIHLRAFKGPVCGCPDYWKAPKYPVLLHLNLCWTCKQISDEFLATWFKDKTIFFHCSCELRESLFSSRHQCSGPH